MNFEFLHTHDETGNDVMVEKFEFQKFLNKTTIINRNVELNSSLPSYVYFFKTL